MRDATSFAVLRTCVDVRFGEELAMCCDVNGLMLPPEQPRCADNVITRVGGLNETDSDSISMHSLSPFPTATLS